MRKINLLYVITKLELGGAQKQLLSLVRRLDKEKFNIFLFTAEDGLLIKDALSINGLTIIRSRCLERKINPLKDLLALIEIYRFIKRNNIDIVHTHSSKAGILGRCAARFARVDFIIHTVHGWSFNDYQPNFIHYIFVWLERLAAQFTHKLIVVSYYDKQKGLINRIGREDKYIVIRYGIDCTEFFKRDQKIKGELGIDNTDLVVTMISCLKPQKSPQDFIKLAFLVNRIQPDINPVRNTTQIENNTIVSNGVKFLLVGDGVLRKKIEKLISKFNLQSEVILTGWRRDVYRILSATDVFVLTSLWEGLPIVALEAAASSIPAVATHTGGIAEVIIDGKTGFLIPSRNPKLMSERLALLLKDENLRRQMGENAKNNLGLKFMLTNTVKDTQNLYDSLFEAKIKRKETGYGDFRFEVSNRKY